MYNTWCPTVSSDILNIPDIPNIPNIPEFPLFVKFPTFQTFPIYYHVKFQSSSSIIDRVMAISKVWRTKNVTVQIRYEVLTN